MSYIFISYAREDHGHALLVKKALSILNIDAWLDTERLKAGYKWNSSIELAIEEAAGAVVLVSEISITKNGYIEYEVDLILKRAKAQSPFLLPIKIDSVDIRNHKISEYQFAEFPGGDTSRIGELISKLSLTFGKMIEVNEEKKEKSIKNRNRTVEEVEGDIASKEYLPADGAEGILFKPDEMNIYCNKISLETWIFHGKNIDYEKIDHLEYNHMTDHIFVHMKDGRLFDLGVKIQWLLRPYIKRTESIQIVRTKDGVAEDGSDYLLVHSGRDPRLSYTENRLDKLKRILEVTSKSPPQNFIKRSLFNRLKKIYTKHRK